MVFDLWVPPKPAIIRPAEWKPLAVVSDSPMDLGLIMAARFAMARRAGPAGFVPIFTPPGPDNSASYDFDAFSLRQVTTSGISQSITQCRVTLKANPTGGKPFRANNLSIGVWTGTGFNTTAIPVELKVAGASGCNLAVNAASVVTDTALLTANSGDKLVFIIDFFDTGTTTDNGVSYHIGNGGDGGYRFQTSYNLATVTSFTSASYSRGGYSLIEGQ